MSVRACLYGKLLSQTENRIVKIQRVFTFSIEKGDIQ